MAICTCFHAVFPSEIMIDKRGKRQIPLVVWGGDSASQYYLFRVSLNAVVQGLARKYTLPREPINGERTSVAVIFAIIQPRDGHEHTFKANDWPLCGRDGSRSIV